jgi:hypothetical protein
MALLPWIPGLVPAYLVAHQAHELLFNWVFSFSCLHFCGRRDAFVLSKCGSWDALPTRMAAFVRQSFVKILCSMISFLLAPASIIAFCSCNRRQLPVKPRNPVSSCPDQVLVHEMRENEVRLDILFRLCYDIDGCLNLLVCAPT